MRVLNLVGLLLVATRPTRSVTTKPGHDCGELLGLGEANAATRIASSTFSDTMSPSQEWAMPHDEIQNLPFSEFKYWLQDNSFFELYFCNVNRVDLFGECSSMNERHSSPGLKFDASHINIESQQLSQEGENLGCLIDPNRIPIDSEIVPSTGFLENLVPANRNAQQFGDSSSRNLGDWNSSTISNRDAFSISVDGQQSTGTVEGSTFDCRIKNTINSEHQTVDVHENFVPDEFPEHTRKIVHPSALGLRKFCPPLNWDLDEVKDYESLCVFLGKETNPEQVEFHNSVAMTEYMMTLLLRGKSGRDTVEVRQNNIDVPHPRLFAKATSTLQKLILISNFVLKLVSCRKSLLGVSRQVTFCFKHTCIPVLQCLVTCCGKDMDLFQARWGTCFKHTGFGKKWCPGPGSNHNTCGSQMTKIVKAPDKRDKDSGLFLLKTLLDAASTAEHTLYLCWKFNEIYQSSDPVFARSYQQYYSRSTKPIWGCFVHHCGQNTNEWRRKWGSQFAHGEFSMRRCRGLKSRRCGENDPPFDIEARHELRKKSKSTRDLLPALSEILEEYDQYLTVKTKSMRWPHPDLTALISKCVRPVNNCLQRHCAGDVEEFVRRWGKLLFYYTFRHDCCTGKEDAICQYNSPPITNKLGR